MGDGLESFKCSFVDGGVSLVVLMIDEELLIKRGQQGIFLEFLKDGDHEVPLVVLNSQNQTGIALFVELLCIVDAQFFDQKVEVVRVSCSHRKVEIASELINRLIDVELVVCESFEDVPVGLISDGSSKDCFPCLVLSSEVDVVFEQSLYHGGAVESDCHFKRCLPIGCGEFKVRGVSFDDGVEESLVAVFNCNVNEPLFAFVVNLIDIGIALFDNLFNFGNIAFLSQFDESAELVHGSKQQIVVNQWICHNQKDRMIYSFLLYCLLTLLCVYLVDYYASKEVSPYVKVWSVITWVLNFGLAFLVPEDVYETLKGREGQHTNRLGLQYLLLYWLVYLLTWTVIPLLQEWEDAGDIQSSQRMKRSLRINGIFYLILLGVGAVSLLVLVLLGAGKEMGLFLYLKCLAMIWGMFLLIILLGYSLVEIPRTMWRNAHPRQYLTYLYHRIYQMQVEVEQAKREFKQVTAYISHVSKQTQDQDILRYCQTSLSLIPDNMQDIVNSNYQKVIASTGYLETYPICLESSIQHNRLMKRAIARVRRQLRGLHEYLVQAVFYEDIKLALDQGTELRSVARQTSQLESMWYCRIRPTSDKVLACCIACCCVVLLVSQTQVFLSDSSSILGYLLLFKNIEVLRVLVFLVMAFLIYMANYALFRLKLANLYGLYRKESDGASLMFATVNFSRISVAIVLNFFDMVKMEDSTYSHVMQVVEMGLLGEWVLKGLPGLLWLIVLSHYFNVWGWVAKKAGFEGSYTFLSHQLETSSEGHPSQSLVSRKREQLQKGRMENVFRELDNF